MPALSPLRNLMCFVQTEHMIYCQSSAYQTALTSIIKDSLSNPVGTQGPERHQQQHDGAQNHL